MSKTIESIWKGDLDPSLRFGMYSPEMRRLYHSEQEAREKLEKGLGEEQKKLLEKYCDEAERCRYAAAEQAFCDGFCVGTRLTAEAMLGSERVL